MSFNAKAIFSADGTGYFRELGKVEGAAAKLAATGEKQAKIAADATKEKIALEQKLANLKRGEANLAPRVQATAAAGEEARARAAGSAMATAQLERERAAQAKLAAEAARAGKAKLAAEAALAKVQGRVDARAVGSALPVKLEEQLAAAKARVVLATQAQAKAEAARDAHAAARGARLAQLERRAATLASAATSAKAGSQEHDRLTAALARVRGQAAKTTGEIERLARVSKAAAAASATAFSGAKAATPTVGGQTKSGLAGAGGSLIAGFGAPLGVAAAGAGIAALTHKTVEYGGRINDLSARLGVSTDALQEFDYAMTLNGATLDDAAAAMQKLGAARQEALEKGGEKLEAFKALGIDVDQLKTARLEDLFKTVGRSVRDAADVQTVLGDAMQVMGKGSENVLAAMRADLEAAGAEAQRLGLIIGEDTIAKLDALGDKTDTLGKRMMAGFAPFLGIIAEAGHRIMDLVGIVQSLALIPVRMAGAIYGGASPQRAMKEAVAAGQADFDRIIAGYNARQEPRSIAPRGEAALAFRGEGVDENAAVQSAARVLSLRERIAKLDRDALPLAERRAAIEQDILKKRAELAEVEATQDTSQGGAGEEAALKLQLDLRQMEKELAGTDEKEDKGAGRAPERNVDSLARVGVFMGGAPVGVRTTPLTGDQAEKLNTNLVRALQASNAVLVAAVNRSAQTTKEVLG